jgi:hypothetical protein
MHLIKQQIMLMASKKSATNTQIPSVLWKNSMRVQPEKRKMMSNAK